MPLLFCFVLSACNDGSGRAVQDKTGTFEPAQTSIYDEEMLHEYALPLGNRSSVTVTPTLSPTPEPTPSPSPSPTPTPVAYQDLYSTVLSVEPGDAGADGVITTPGFPEASEVLEILTDAMDSLNSDWFDYGYLMLDLKSGEGVFYNIDEVFYTASSIKGPYAASLADIAPDIAFEWENTIVSMLKYSDNDAYTALNDTYRRVYIQQWCEETGIDPDPFRYKYPHIGTRELAMLWIRAYEFFEESENGDAVGAWFEEPANSLIHGVLGEEYTTRSKGGWIVPYTPPEPEIGEDGELIEPEIPEGAIISTEGATVDAGIVYAGDHPYLVAIMSDLPSSFNTLVPLMEAIEEVHCLITAQ